MTIGALSTAKRAPESRAAACDMASMQAAAVALFARFAEAARQEQASAATAAALC